MTGARRKAFDKRGMYIVEASVVLPIFIVAMLLLTGLIPVTTSCGRLAFACADELRLDSAKAAFTKRGTLAPLAFKRRVLKENKNVKNVLCTRYARFFEKGGIDDLISIRFTAVFRNDITVLNVGKVRFGLKMTGRAFTGTTHKVGGDGSLVYIFPESGEKFHKKGCRYLTSHCHMTFLTEDLMKEYHPCPLCKASELKIGSQVICFSRYGDAYHRSRCRSVEKEKYYIETTKGSATSSGYTRCSVCGG